MQQPDSKFSMYSKLRFACLYPHIWKSGGYKNFFSLAPLANHVLYPSLLESRRRPLTSLFCFIMPCYIPKAGTLNDNIRVLLF